MKRLNVLAVLLLMVVAISAQNYKTVSNISYTSKKDAYAKERLKLDVYYPEGKKDCPVIVWFHGGGLEAGQKEIPEKNTFSKSHYKRKLEEWIIRKKRWKENEAKI